MIILFAQFIVFSKFCTDIDECAEGVDGCSQTCTNRIGSYNCSCNTGYRIAIHNNHGCDGISCPICLFFCITPTFLADIDECAEGRDSCAQTCTNTIGSYSCLCGSGYLLASDGRTCNGRLKHALILATPYILLLLYSL